VAAQTPVNHCVGFEMQRVMKVDKAGSGINVRSRGNGVSFKYKNGTSQNLLDLILLTQTT
jgi:hypothetical protein